jgi:protein-disulfide isomerase
VSRLRAEYIDTGKVRFVYKHFAILGPESNRVAEASECAAEQDEFWAYHDLIFEDQIASRNQLSEERLVSLAGQIGLDPAAFQECLNSGRYVDRVRQESASVQALGVRGTPAFLINGQFVSGAQPYEVFQQVIEEQLQAAVAN